MAGPVKVIIFSVNGQKVELTDPSPQTSLNEWLRSQYGLTGTKRMCGEGGCGCCVVSVTKTDLLSNKPVTIAINSVRDNNNHIYLIILFIHTHTHICSVCVLCTLLMDGLLLQLKELEGNSQCILYNNLPSLSFVQF